MQSLFFLKRDSGLSGLSFSQTPFPFMAKILFLSAGMSRKAVSGSPLVKRAIDIAQYGMPAAKLVVPSSGSTTQYSLELGIDFLPSSLRTPSPGAIVDYP